MQTATDTAERPSPPIAGMTAARISLDRYHAMIEAGILGEDDRIELIDGRLIEKMSINPPHAVAVYLTAEWLRRNEGARGLLVFQERPLTIPEANEIEPDLMLVARRDDLYLARHPLPSDVALVIEVSDETLAKDRKVKLPIYAAAGIAEYWIVNLRERQLERYAEPTAAAEQAPASYSATDVIAGGAAFTHETFGIIRAAELLPPVT